MSDEQPAALTPPPPASETSDLLERISPPVLIAAAAGATLVALLAIVSLVMLVSLSSDVSRLEDQVRKLNKHSKVMEQELADLRGKLEAAAPRPAVASSPKPTAPRPSHIDTADPASDCVIGAGSKGSLANCLK
jgi:hypothetical protein